MNFGHDTETVIFKPMLVNKVITYFPFSLASFSVFVYQLVSFFFWSLTDRLFNKKKEINMSLIIKEIHMHTPTHVYVQKHIRETHLQSAQPPIEVSGAIAMRVH